MKPEPFAPISQLILSRKNGYFAKKMRYLANRDQNHANFLANRKGGRSQFKQSKTVAEMLLKRQAEQNELKELFGDEYTDYGLVFCSPMGTPIEGQVINRALNKLIEDNGLPKVVFHSLRHSSITYKLKLNGGDMKSVQGDSGHAQLKMVADVYSHIIDEDRRLNAKRFEDAFYSGHKTEDELDGLHARSIEQAAAPQPAEPETDQQLLLKLLNNPEMAALLKTLAKSL